MVIRPLSLKTVGTSTPITVGIERPTNSINKALTPFTAHFPDAVANKGSGRTITHPSTNAGRSTSTCTGDTVHKTTIKTAYSNTQCQSMDQANRCIPLYAAPISTTTMPKSPHSPHEKPAISICKGTSKITVSKSSRTANTRALRNSQVAPNPAALSMENNTPADVGAAKRPASRHSSHAALPPPALSGQQHEYEIETHKNPGKPRRRKRHQIIPRAFFQRTFLQHKAIAHTHHNKSQSHQSQFAKPW